MVLWEAAPFLHRGGEAEVAVAVAAVVGVARWKNQGKEGQGSGSK